MPNSDITHDISCTTAILGGSFDPPHQGHISIINKIRSEYKFNLVIIALTSQNPLKGRVATAYELRIEMLKKVLSAENIPLTDNPLGEGVFISDHRYQFTYEFVDFWRKNYQKNFIWVIGEDLIDQVIHWKQWARL